MFCSSLLSSPTFCSSFHFHPIRCLRNHKIRIMRFGPLSNTYFGWRAGRSRASDKKKMTTELVGIDSLSGGIRNEKEAESILGVGFEDFESNLNRMSKWLVAALFGLAILWKHDEEALWAAMGSVLNSALSVVLKRILNHERPSALRSDPGMPSSHAQSIFFSAVFAVLSLFNWLGMNAFTVSIGLIILFCGTYLSWLRVPQRLHTVSQIVVGAIFGSACSVSWFWMWHSIVARAFITSIWVRIIVVLGSISCCLLFLLYVILNWLKEE